MSKQKVLISAAACKVARSKPVATTAKNAVKKVNELSIKQLLATVMVEVKKQLEKEFKKSLAASLKREKSLVKEIPAIVKLAELKAMPSKKESLRRMKLKIHQDFVEINERLKERYPDQYPDK